MERDFQDLLSVVDYNTTSDPDKVASALEPFQENTGKARWLVVLYYAEHRIEPAVKELHTRTRHLVSAMGGGLDNLMSSTWDRESDSRNSDRHGELGVLVAALRDAIVALATRKEIRKTSEERLERELARWRQDAR